MHLAGDTVDVVTIPTVIGLQGKKHRSTKQINPGIGTGERLQIGWPAFTYESAQPGFAEHDLEEFDRLASDLAFSRTLQVLRKAFGKDLDLENRWEEQLEGEFIPLLLGVYWGWRAYWYSALLLHEPYWYYGALCWSSQPDAYLHTNHERWYRDTCAASLL